MRRPGPGRPPSDNPRRNVVPVRLTDAERDAVRIAATHAGLSISDYLRTAGTTRAEAEEADHAAVTDE